MKNETSVRDARTEENETRSEPIRCAACGTEIAAPAVGRLGGACPRCVASFVLAEDDEAASPALHVSVGLGTPATRAPAADSPAVRGPEPEREAAAVEPGSTFGGLEVLGLIGRGGMGVVYKARQIALDRIVALKVLSPRLAADPEFASRFHREARALAALGHPGIVQVHDFGREGDRYYLVMEHLDGSLRGRLRAGPLPPAEAVRILGQLCEAFDYAHGQGIVHRDIKPENILLDRHGRARVADFGLAKMIGGSAPGEGSTLTQAHVVLGTPRYMAPEQAMGARDLDHRADIYALGVVLHEMLTGETPSGTGAGAVGRDARLDPRLRSVLRRALDAEPERRYARAGELAKAVADALARPAAEDAPVDVIDLATGEALGTSEVRAVRVVSLEHDVRVEGWSLPQIGVRGGCATVRLAEGDGVEIALEEEDATVNVPADVRLEIAAGEGRAVVRGHRGRLSVERTGAGAARVLGLATDGLEIRTDEGEVEVDGLALAAGAATIRTRGGAVRVGIAVEASSLVYDLETSGDTTVDVGAIEEDDAGRVRGRVGDGRARLRVVGGPGGSIAIDEARIAAPPAVAAAPGEAPAPAPAPAREPEAAPPTPRPRSLLVEAPCPSCGKENPSWSDLCAACGARVFQPCPACARRASVAAAACPSCALDFAAYRRAADLVAKALSAEAGGRLEQALSLARQASKECAGHEAAEDLYQELHRRKVYWLRSREDARTATREHRWVDAAGAWGALLEKERNDDEALSALESALASWRPTSEAVLIVWGLVLALGVVMFVTGSLEGATLGDAARSVQALGSLVAALAFFVCLAVWDRRTRRARLDALARSARRSRPDSSRGGGP